MRYKKIIAAVLCVSLALSGLGTVFAAMPDGGISNIKIPFVDKGIYKEPPKAGGNTEDTEKIAADIAPKPGEKLVKVNLPKDKGESIFYSSERAVSGDEAMKSKDYFNISQNDIEELMKQGYSMEDIFEADELGNKLLVDPRLLLERSKKENKSLSDIEEEITKEKKADILDKQNKNKASAETLKKYGLSSAEAEGLSDEAINKLGEISEKTGVPVKELVYKLKAKKQKE